MPPTPSPGDPSATVDAPPARPRRRRLPLTAGVAALAVAVGVAGVGVATTRLASGAPEPVIPIVVEDAPVEEAMPPPTTAIAAPAAVPAPAPRTVPAQPPADERAPTPLVRVGEIRIPRIGLVHPMYEGVTLTVIDHGPGHWPGSAMPGQRGNAVFAGHRVTHSHPFRKVDQLVVGDEIFFTTADGEFKYLVTGTEIVGPRDTWIVNPTPDATVTLFACHPPGSARQRIVVRGTFAGPSDTGEVAAPGR